MRLSNGQQGKIFKVVQIHGEGPLTERLMDLGILRGAEITVLRYAPLKDPIAIRVKGTRFSLRVAEAERIEVEPLTEGSV